MTLILHRHVIGQSQGIYQNILPWERGSIGRYISIQVATLRLELLF